MDKKTAPFHRIIVDLREVNKYMAKWKAADKVEPTREVESSRQGGTY